MRTPSDDPGGKEVLAATPDEVAGLLASNPRGAAYAIVERGTGWLELRHEGGAIVLAWPTLWGDRPALVPHLMRARTGYAPLVLLGTDPELTRHGAGDLDEELDVSVEVLPLSEVRLYLLLARARGIARLRRDAAEGELLADRYRYELDELNAIGRALSSQRDLDELLSLILEKARYVTGADAGSVFVIEQPTDEPKGREAEDLTKRRLRFKVAQNDSVALDFSETTLPVSPSSIVGRCVLSREVINIPDLYKLDDAGAGNNPWGFRHNRDFDQKIGYQTRSVLAVPMVDAHEQVIGVIQLINKKRRPEHRLASEEDFTAKVVTFDMRSQELASTLASQAGISIENAILYADIRNLFDGFVRASVVAIESRDPTTSGHSQRVADLTCALARSASAAQTGPYAAFSVTADELKRIEYAGLLHDFGKVGVRENVLVKAKKLYEHERELMLARFDFIRKSLQAEASDKKLDYLLAADRDARASQAGELDTELGLRLAELDDYVRFILKANEPTVLDQGGFERLADIAARTFIDAAGERQAYLRPHEVKSLQILRGSLTTDERLEIESHVVHTFNFLRRIPWGRSFKDVPDIAGAHHEKLDGTGYPNRLRGDAIPAPARMMTIADIFDALAARDRPYKRAVPVDKALDIIASEVKAGKCDAELFRIFVEAKVYDVVKDS